MQGFVTVPVNFAGKRLMHLTIYAGHLLQRWAERMGIAFVDGKACAQYMADLFTDERLCIILDRVPNQATVALFYEACGCTLFFSMGTKHSADEIKVSTIVGLDDGRKTGADDADLCYVLPITGQLRFGRERKYFKAKRRR